VSTTWFGRSPHGSEHAETRVRGLDWLAGNRHLWRYRVASAWRLSCHCAASLYENSPGESSPATDNAEVYPFVADRRRNCNSHICRYL